jgi:hypothetical protein
MRCANEIYYGDPPKKCANKMSKLEISIKQAKKSNPSGPMNARNSNAPQSGNAQHNADGLRRNECLF